MLLTSGFGLAEVVLLTLLHVNIPCRIVSYRNNGQPCTNCKAVFTADEMNWTDRHQVDPVTRRLIGHARQRHEVDWLHGYSARTAVQFNSFAVNTA